MKHIKWNIEKLSNVTPWNDNARLERGLTVVELDWPFAVCKRCSRFRVSKAGGGFVMTTVPEFNLTCFPCIRLLLGKKLYMVN